MTDKEKVKKLMHSDINDDFDLSIDDIASKVGTSGRFGAWLSGDKSKIKQVLEAVESVGVSPAFFASYEINEGYNAQFGWLNHSYPQGDWLADAKAVAKVVKSQSEKDGTPAWADSYNSSWTPPQDVINKGNKDFKNLDYGTIGRAYIPLTAASTWATYYPEGLNKSVNGIQDYPNPFLDSANTILKWGGKIDGEGGHGKSDNDKGGHDLSDGIQAVFDALQKKLDEWLTWDLHSIGSNEFFANHYFKLFKTYNNTYHIEITTNFLSELGDVLSKFGTIATGGDHHSSGDDGDGGDSEANTCYLHPERNYMQGFYPTAQEAINAGYPFPQAHKGLDMRMTYETLKSAVSGTAYIGYEDGSGWGNRVVVYTDHGEAFLFGHLSKISVSNGDKVKIGDKLGVTGKTGMAKGPHLHVEQIENANKSWGANPPPEAKRIDPTDWVIKHCKKVSKDNFKMDSTVYQK